MKMLLNLDSERKILKYFTGIWPYIWLLIIVFALYFRSLFFQYTFFDDHVLILNRLSFFQKLSNFGKIFYEDAFNNYVNKFYYRPFLTASFFMDGWIGGGKLWLFHLSNIIFHLLACYLVFIFLKRITRLTVTSFILTAIFAVHPVITQVVVWIPGRNDSLVTIFILLSFIALLKYNESNRIYLALISLLSFSVALLIKELTVFLPVVLFLYIFIFRTEHKKRILVFIILWLLLIIISVVIRQKVLGNALGQTNMNEIIVSVFQNLPAIPAYLGKIFIPVHLSVYPDLKDMIIPIIIGSISIVLMLLSFFYKPADKKLLLFGLLWFLIFLIPGFIKAANLSEHRVYMPMIGVLIFIAGLMGELRIKHIPVFIFMFCVLLTLNIYHSRNFKDRLTLWQQAVISSPSSAFNANNLGAMYTLKNDYVLAEKYFRQALKLNPRQPLANGNLGLILMSTNRFNEAELYLVRENTLNPNYDNAYFNLGTLYFKKGETQMGLDYFIKTISVNPGHVEAYKALLYYYRNNNQPELAQQIYNLALRYGIKLQ
jgi:protein O-mannosyl-transferase